MSHGHPVGELLFSHINTRSKPALVVIKDFVEAKSVRYSMINNIRTNKPDSTTV
jgi:hypothetical protein